MIAVNTTVSVTLSGSPAYHLLGALLWEAFEGEAAYEAALVEVGESLGIDAVEGEGYIDTIGRVCRERVREGL